MVLIRSISGIRGTIGGKPGDGLSPVDILNYSAAFAMHTRQKRDREKLKIVIGRDARVSGEMVRHIVVGTLLAMGVEVIDLGLSTTPTVEMAVADLQADGGIILTASHNPVHWNALKLLDDRGEFISSEDGQAILDIINQGMLEFCQSHQLGSCIFDRQAIQRHIDKIMALPLVDEEAIRKAGLRVAIDTVNSSGSLALVPLLHALGVQEIIELNSEPTGNFAHNPEPLPENLRDLAETVIKSEADLGFAVDPDTDRLAIVTEKGDMFGEEYTLVAVADYILQNNPGNTVSNLSSSRALRDITLRAGGQYFAAAVGEVNVVRLMKECKAVIGGEGNGGVIYPDLHYGRDALAGIALFLSYLARKGSSCSGLRSVYPSYYMAKKKLELSPEINVDKILKDISAAYDQFDKSHIDGLKINFEQGWVHIRKSNTEPIIRIYTEGRTENQAEEMAEKFTNLIQRML